MVVKSKKSSHIVIIAVGKDKPGLIAGLSSAVASLGGNIEDMDEVVLRNSIFIMSMFVDVSLCSKEMEAIRDTLVKRGEELGLRVNIYDAASFGV